MKERSRLIEYLRGEIVGPARSLFEPEVIEFRDGAFVDSTEPRRGAVAWRPPEGDHLEEVLYYDRESPHRKYGVGQLHPDGAGSQLGPAETAAESTDTLGADLSPEEIDEGEPTLAATEKSADSGEVADPEFDIASPDVRRPTTIGLSCCVQLRESGSLVVRLPVAKRFAWQEPDALPFPVNGRYERCTRIVRSADSRREPYDVWRRVPAFRESTVAFSLEELRSGRQVAKPVPSSEDSPLALEAVMYARTLAAGENRFLVTVVLRNRSRGDSSSAAKAATLFQTYFEVSTEGGRLLEYPESERPFSMLDPDEQSLKLLYRDTATWAIGHGCAGGWDAPQGSRPTCVFADVLPAVETPSMTPDVTDQHGAPIRLRMRDLAALPDEGTGPAWNALRALADEYEAWICRRRAELGSLPPELAGVGARHMASCQEALERIRHGIALLERAPEVRTAFRLANLAMLLQQISTKQLQRRPLAWDSSRNVAHPQGEHNSPWSIYDGRSEHPTVGSWRAFQLAFLLMQIEGVAQEGSPDRKIVDLIWFPTGGGKTEAYLAVMAFLVFHERLRMLRDATALPRDGTNILMRYTLRMLTTQQFQRAASLIAAMEFLRRNPELHGEGDLPGRRFSVALWIGGEGTPNSIRRAAQEVGAFVRGKVAGNPLVLTECPWCRAEIGRCAVPRGGGHALAGITTHRTEGPLLHCPDPMCAFGKERPSEWLPVEVIDERIYSTAPSLVIATADKFAMAAYRPQAGALFGRAFEGGKAVQVRTPPALIVQDELHLIAGPLGTIYALYEGVIERLCTVESPQTSVCPKVIASTATIRGAADQVRALYARVGPDGGETMVRLFPSPGLAMGDSFFGRYARHPDGKLQDGRLYIGIHATGYGSVLTAQVRAFAAALCAPLGLSAADRDAWWTLLAFYNSLRELGGAKTLFDSDIRSRLKFLQNRENVDGPKRRNLVVVEELTSRLSQAEIVQMMDRLAIQLESSGPSPVDACLASSIIEVGVDIERLSLMGVVGQPKTSAQYIQVTGRVGRRWWERPGLILMLYSPSRSRDRSHFEQFHSYHRRLYEYVEPTSATPFAVTAIERACCGALILWARQHADAAASSFEAYREAVMNGAAFLANRCRAILGADDCDESVEALQRMRDELIAKWAARPQAFEEFPPAPDGEYLMLWPGQYATVVQRKNGVVVPSSMRQVDRSAELIITQAYANAMGGEVG
jgi:hypothetical protein